MGVNLGARLFLVSATGRSITDVRQNAPTAMIDSGEKRYLMGYRVSDLKEREQCEERDGKVFRSGKGEVI